MFKAVFLASACALLNKGKKEFSLSYKKVTSCLLSLYIPCNLFLKGSACFSAFNLEASSFCFLISSCFAFLAAASISFASFFACLSARSLFFLASFAAVSMSFSLFFSALMSLFMSSINFFFSAAKVWSSNFCSAFCIRLASLAAVSISFAFLFSALISFFILSSNFLFSATRA